MKNLKAYLTIQKAALLLGVSARTLRRWDSAGKLKPLRNPINRYRLYDKQELIFLLGRIGSAGPQKDGGKINMKCAQLTGKISKVLTAVLAAAVLTLAAAPAAWAGVEYDLSSVGNFNMAFDGDQAEGRLNACAAGDFNGDGISDLAMQEYRADNQNRADSGSIWVVYGPVISTATGITKSIAANFNTRIDGPLAGSTLLGCWTMDVNNDSQQDIVTGDANGNLYFKYGPLPAGTSNVIDLADTSQYNLKIQAPSGYSDGGNYRIWPYPADLNNDGIDDLLLELPLADSNGTDSGAIYVFYGPLPSGTGNMRDLGTPTDWNLRISGPAGLFLTAHAWPADVNAYRFTKASSIGDLNGDGIPDLAVGAAAADYNGRTNSGSVWVTTGPFPSGTGNSINLSDSAKYMVRFDGPTTPSNYTGLGALVTADFNGDGKNDLCMASPNLNTLGRTYNGAVYCVMGPFNYSLGSPIDLANSGNYNVVFNGGVNYSYTGVSGFLAADLNNDGIQDLIIRSPWDYIAGVPNTGVLYVRYGGSTWPSGTGNSKDLGVVTDYNVRITHQLNGYNYVGYYPPALKDIDRDGVIDMVVVSMGYLTGPEINNSGYYAPLAIYYGPFPAGTANNWEMGANYDYRFRDSYWSQMHVQEGMWRFSEPIALEDFNGDGILDIPITRIYYDGAYTNQGRVYVVSLAKATPLITSPGLFTNNTDPTITWTAVPGGVNYRMQLAPNPLFNSPISDQTVAATSAGVSSLTNASSYYVRVKATDATGLANRWGPVHSFTVDNTAPTAPTLVTPGNATGSHPPVGTQTPTFDWTDASPE